MLSSGQNIQPVLTSKIRNGAFTVLNNRITLCVQVSRMKSRAQQAEL